jgi:hypothetical protein
MSFTDVYFDRLCFWHMYILTDTYLWQMYVLNRCMFLTDVCFHICMFWQMYVLTDVLDRCMFWQMYVLTDVWKDVCFWQMYVFDRCVLTDVCFDRCFEQMYVLDRCMSSTDVSFARHMFVTDLCFFIYEWCNTICCVYWDNLLIMNNYLYETCRE